MLIRDEGLLCGEHTLPAREGRVVLVSRLSRFSPANRGQLWDRHGRCSSCRQRTEGGSALCGHPARLHPQLHVSLFSYIQRLIQHTLEGISETLRPGVMFTSWNCILMFVPIPCEGPSS